MKNNRLLGIGLGGFSIAGICCATPILVVLLTSAGLFALVGWLDYVLFPAMAIFAAITIYALWNRWKLKTA